MEAKQLWTKQLTEADSPFIVQQNYGFSKFNVVCETKTAIILTGTGIVGVHASSPINLNQGESFGWDEESPCEDWTITIPSGATCKCIAVK